MRALIVAAAILAVPAGAQLPYQAPDYTQDSNWLCRPDRVGARPDACAADLSITSVAANGTITTMPVPTAAAPAIDCFYVYPTVSTDPTSNSDMTIDAAETSVARVQFAAFRSVCRTFAPMYRQVTLKALRNAMTGQATSADRAMAYRDVVAAWNDYLARDNKGRGVILVGHSQGSGVIKALLQNEIEGKPAARLLVAAYIPGHNVLVPRGQDVGGDLKSTPLCRSTRQTGCAVTWVSFRDGKVPPPDSRFGRTPAPGMAVACVNPAALAGGRAPLAAILPNGRAIVDNASEQPEWTAKARVSSAFVMVPGLLSGACTEIEGAHVLAIRTNADPADPRTDAIGGDVKVGGMVFENWGLHLIDVNAVLGDLVVLADAQGKAWLADH